VRVAVLTREWPPDVYGGAGVHVEFLCRELARLVDLRVESFAVHPGWERLVGANPTLSVLASDLSIAAAVADRELVHSHTWYANLAGHLASLLYRIPHVVTAHSLEPLRPWKAEQLAGGYAVSSWVERVALPAADAVIAVSGAMREDVLRVYPQVDPDRVHVVHNGIDADEYAPAPDRSALRGYGIDPDRPCVVFVGRITRQKGLPHLLAAASALPKGPQLVLCAAAPDTAEVAAETAAGVQRLRDEGHAVIWLDQPVSRAVLVELLTAASVFVCPSIYEPLGIVNLEAMACATAVVASRVGGIPEVVADGETGVLVDYDPAEPARFEAGLAAAIAGLLEEPDRAQAMGQAGRTRVIAEFSWRSVAQRTLEVYRSVSRGR
jgi:starch synthase